MSIELKPCPFCGGEAEALSFAVLSPTIHGVTSVVCTECAAGIEVDTAELWLHDAAWYWNTRAERTCHDANTRFDAWTCSECKCTQLLMFDDFGEPTLSVDGVADVPHYCPNCGAKVVEE